MNRQSTITVLLLSYGFRDDTTILRFYHFSDDADARKFKVNIVMQERCANVTLHRTDDMDDAQIRISYTGSARWSFLGLETPLPPSRTPWFFGYLDPVNVARRGQKGARFCVS